MPPFLQVGNLPAGHQTGNGNGPWPSADLAANDEGGFEFIVHLSSKIRNQELEPMQAIS